MEIIQKKTILLTFTPEETKELNPDGEAMFETSVSRRELEERIGELLVKKGIIKMCCDFTLLPKSLYWYSKDSLEVGGDILTTENF